MPGWPLPEVAAFQVFRRGRIWVFGDIDNGVLVYTNIKHGPAHICNYVV